MRTSINIQTIQAQISKLSQIQTKLKSVQLSTLSTAELIKLVSDLSEINGKIKAFNSIVATHATTQK